MRPLLPLLLASLSFLGCNSCGAAETAPPEEAVSPEAVSPEAVDDTPRGTVVGVIRLTEGLELPSYPVQRLASGDPMPVGEGCPPRQQGDRHPVQRSGDGLLGVQVTALMALELAPPHEPVTHEAVIEQCRLTPGLINATRGDTLVIRNDSDYPFVPILGSSSFGRALLRGQTRSVALERGGVPALTCTFPASCGRTDVIINFHSVHTQSGEGGAFRLEGVPAGERTIVAYHPLLAETEQTVTVEEGQTVTVNFTLELAPAPPAPPAAEPAEGPAELEDGVLF